MPSTGTEFVPLGRLPAGTYSVIVTFEFTFAGDDVAYAVTLPPFELVVAPGAYPIPSLDYYGRIAIAVALAVLAVFALGKK